jgi:hypothetical protein
MKQLFTKSPMSAWERFLSYISPEPNSGCWLWMAGCSSEGHGSFQYEDGKSRGAHKIAYELMRGPVPAGKELHHNCEVKSCVNPDHMVPLTRREHLVWHQNRSPRKIDNTLGVLASIEHFKLIPNCKWGHPKAVYNKRNRDGTTYCAKCRMAHNDKKVALVSEQRRLVREAKIVAFDLD